MAKISVPQDDGEIRIVRNGDLDDPTVYPVTNGTVDVDDENVAHFLSVLTGSALVEDAKSKSDLKNDKTAAPTA